MFNLFCGVGKEKSMAKQKAGTSTLTNDSKIHKGRASVLSVTKKEYIGGIINNYNSANKCLEDALKHRVATARILAVAEDEYSVIEDKTIRKQMLASWKFSASSVDKLNPDAKDNWNTNFKGKIKSYNFLNMCFKLRKWLTSDGKDIDRKRIKQALLSPQTIANMTGSRTLGDELGHKVSKPVAPKQPKKIDYQKQVMEFKQLIEKGINEDDLNDHEVKTIKQLFASIQHIVDSRGNEFPDSIIQ